ncbi:hypothetical protein A6J61_03430 [Staphylococcus lugdunensis]|nr:hypothetical protein A6J61_03430 [Staphylococcus lugdunensis]PNZ65554.1 hypothetical protein CD041_00290 [Staphylococcus lugdunensis]
MLIHSIYGETPEGAVPVEDRGPNKKTFQKKVNEQRELGWLRRHPRKAKPFNTKYCENREQQQDIF